MRLVDVGSGIACACSVAGRARRWTTGIAVIAAALVLGASPAQGAESIVTVDSAGDAGVANSLVLDAAGNPVIAYSNRDTPDGEVKLVHCDDPNCVGPEMPVTVAVGHTYKESLALDASGNPVIAYWADSNPNPSLDAPDLRLAHCSDPNCTGSKSIQIVDGTDVISSGGQEESVGYDPALELDSAGNPVIAYSGPISKNGTEPTTPHPVLLVAHCNDPNCAGDNESIHAPDELSNGNIRQDISLELDAAGRPVISELEPASQVLRLVHCTDVNCSDRVVNNVTNTAAFGGETSLKLNSAGNPVISYYRGGSAASLNLVVCNDPSCDGFDDPSVPVDDGINGRGLYSSLVLAPGDVPVISYRQDSPIEQHVAVVRCGSVNCASGNVIRTIDADLAPSTSLRLDASGNPVISYAVGNTGSDLRLAHCDDPFCSPPNSPPVAGTDTYSTDENTLLIEPAPGVLGNDTDTDGDTLSAVLVSSPSHGTVTLNADGSFTYTPAAGYSGPDSFTYKAGDGAASSEPATVTITVTPAPAVFSFTGFFAPVDNLPTLNSVKAGSAVPVKFSLAGDQGLNIFAAAYPKSEKIACDSSLLVDGIEETVTAGASSLQYDPLTDQYTYVWKTDKSWAKTCRQLVVKLSDDTVHRANFQLR
jgi:hypothetical protein